MAKKKAAKKAKPATSKSRARAPSASPDLDPLDMAENVNVLHSLESDLTFKPIKGNRYSDDAKLIAHAVLASAQYLGDILTSIHHREKGTRPRGFDEE